MGNNKRRNKTIARLILKRMGFKIFSRYNKKHRKRIPLPKMTITTCIKDENGNWKDVKEEKIL